MCCCLELLAKITLFILNLISVILSIILIILGVLILRATDVNDQLTIPVYVYAIPITIIVIGAIIFLVSLSGCCGALQEVKCLLITYVVFMLIFAGVMTYLAVMIFQAVDTIQVAVTEWVTEMFQSHQIDGAFNALETAFKCCGSTGENSYLSMGFIPGSCCANPISVDGLVPGGSVCVPGTTYDGCASIITDMVKRFITPFGYFIIGIVVVEIIAIFFALFLNYRITRNRRKEKQRQAQMLRNRVHNVPTPKASTSY